MKLDNNDNLVGTRVCDNKCEKQCDKILAKYMEAMLESASLASPPSQLSHAVTLHTDGG